MASRGGNITPAPVRWTSEYGPSQRADGSTGPATRFAHAAICVYFPSTSHATLQARPDSGRASQHASMGASARGQGLPRRCLAPLSHLPPAWSRSPPQAHASGSTAISIPDFVFGDSTRRSDRTAPLECRPFRCLAADDIAVGHGAGWRRCSPRKASDEIRAARHDERCSPHSSTPWMLSIVSTSPHPSR